MADALAVAVAVAVCVVAVPWGILSLHTLRTPAASSWPTPRGQRASLRKKLWCYEIHGCESMGLLMHMGTPCTNRDRALGHRP